jgi:1,4-dihydroxy-2-naphthoate octaprenyltransferase
MPETNNISRQYSVAAILLFLCFDASLAPSSGVSLNQISCLVGLLLGVLCSCCSVVFSVGPYPTVVIHCWYVACVLSRTYPKHIW